MARDEDMKKKGTDAVDELIQQILQGLDLSEELRPRIELLIRRILMSNLSAELIEALSEEKKDELRRFLLSRPDSTGDAITEWMSRQSPTMEGVFVDAATKAIHRSMKDIRSAITHYSS